MQGTPYIPAELMLPKREIEDQEIIEECWTTRREHKVSASYTEEREQKRKLVELAQKKAPDGITRMTKNV